MGYVFAIGHCVACGKTISFNPHKVPSIRINNEGPREPICRDCANLWNKLHPDFATPIHSEAYEAILEEEL